MYEAHSEIDTPPDDTVIWRYMDLERLLALLRSRSLYLCRLDHLRDPWEGLWPTTVLGSIRSELGGCAPGSVDNILKFFNKMPKAFFVSCWHDNPFESAAFWDQYGNSRGFAIKSTIGRLKNSSRSEMQFFIGRVQYIDYGSPEPMSTFNTLRPAFLKRKSFEHEREVRVLHWELPFIEKQLDWSIAKERYDLPVELDALMESVYISPVSPTWLLDPIRELLRRFDLSNVQVLRSELYDRGVE
jgi:hypothetical protein